MGVASFARYAALCSLVFSTPSVAQGFHFPGYRTGSDLLETCEIPQLNLACLGYIQGVGDCWFGADQINHRSSLLCAPLETPTGDMRDVVVNYLKAASKDDLTLPGAEMVWAALVLHYRCPQNKKGK